MFEQLEKEFGFDGIYATKNNHGEFYVKELGYWVDYYEPNLNLVIDAVNPSTPSSTAVNWSSKDLNIFSSSNLTPSTVNFPAKSLAVFLAAAVLV